MNIFLLALFKKCRPKNDKSSLRVLLNTKGTPLNKRLVSNTTADLNSPYELTLIYELLSSKGMPLNKRLMSNITVDLNSPYELNSLYVNEPGHCYLECTTISHTLERVKKGNISSLKDLLSTKGTPLNRVLRQTSHPELNNNEMNSLYVNEPGLYAIILGSNKPKRNALFDWVCRVVLPSLRRTGPYTIGQEETHANEQKPMPNNKLQKGAKYFFRDDPQMPWVQACPIHM